MKLSELRKQPIALLSENNIVKDIVTSKSTLLDLFRKVGDYVGNWENLFVIYVNEDGEPLAVIKPENIAAALEFFEKFDEEGKKFSDIKLSAVGLEEKFPINKKHTLRRTEPVEKALNIFNNKDERTDAITIVDGIGSYTGKLRRSTLVKKLEEIIEDS